MLYIAVGLGSGMIGGLIMDAIGARRWLQPFLLEALARTTSVRQAADGGQRLTLRDRDEFAYAELRPIFRRGRLWVIIGVGV